MLIEAESVDEAFASVGFKLEEAGAPSWSDWHEAGGSPYDHNYAGRWTGSIFLPPELATLKARGEEYPTTSPNYLQYSSDPDLAEQAITEALEFRMKDIREYRKRIADKRVDLVAYPYNPLQDHFEVVDAMDIWYVKKLTQLLMDEWTPDSGIYDLETWTGSLKYFIERVKANPEKQWLIPVDFHH